MRLHGWTCEECGHYHRETSGYRRPDGALSLACEACGEIERVRRYRGTLGAVAE